MLEDYSFLSMFAFSRGTFLFTCTCTCALLPAANSSLQQMKDRIFFHEIGYGMKNLQKGWNAFFFLRTLPL